MPLPLLALQIADSAAAAVADTVARSTSGALAADTVGADTLGADVLARVASAPAGVLPGVPLTAAGFVTAGGWSLLLVLLAAVAALVAVGRALSALRATDVDGDEILRTVAGYIRAGNLVGAVDFCQSQDSVAARVVSAGVERLGRPIGDIQTAVAAAARRESARATGALDAVRSAALVAACSGVLGTSVGLIGLLRAAAPGVALWPSLVPAAVGAGVGLLLVGLFHAAAGRVADAVAGLDTLTGDFLNLLRGPGA